jgi:hypothetical protein
MSPDSLNEPVPAPSSGDDARAFALAHAVVDVLTRVFFSGLPFLLLWHTAGWDWATALVAAVALGHGLEALLKRALDAGADET